MEQRVNYLHLLPKRLYTYYLKNDYTVQKAIFTPTGRCVTVLVSVRAEAVPSEIHRWQYRNGKWQRHESKIRKAG